MIKTKMFAAPIDPELLPMVRITKGTASFLKDERAPVKNEKRAEALRSILETIIKQEEELEVKRFDWVLQAEDIKHNHEGPVCKMDGDKCSKCQAFLDGDKELLRKEQAVALLEMQMHLRKAQECMTRLGTDLTLQFIPGPSMTPVEKRIESYADTLYNRIHKRVIEGRPLKACAVCSSSTKVTCCAGCYFVYYCDTSHQELNWELHKPICKQIKEKSCVTCCECKKLRSVWNHKNPIWTTALDKEQATFGRLFICNNCRGKADFGQVDPKVLCPRKLWPVCKSALRAENFQNLLHAHSSKQEKVHIVDL
jgi:hypothetical protein